jgi:hypothetical protein
MTTSDLLLEVSERLVLVEIGHSVMSEIPCVIHRLNKTQWPWLT